MNLESALFLANQHPVAPIQALLYKRIRDPRWAVAALANTSEHDCPLI
jgi:hypothetical protein